ncbi:MAG: hypothetical protein LBJ22_07100, partial [Synergistaceae bacterium]|nr:hypothetical protein [Synergistaceae bacterium]
MKKAIGVLTIMVVALLCMGAEEARAAEPNDAYSYLPRDFTLSQNGVQIPRGGTVEVRNNEVLTLTVTYTDYYIEPVATSGDLSNARATVGIPESNQNPAIDGVTVHIYFEPSTSSGGLLDITPQGPVDGIIAIQFTSTLTDLNGSRSLLSTSFPIRVKTASATDFRYLFVPKKMSLRNGGQKVTSLYMGAGQTMELYVETDDD